jgi:hypothetical protein
MVLPDPACVETQKEGGPSLGDCFELVSKASADPLLDTEQLLRWIAFNAAPLFLSGLEQRVMIDFMA